MTRLLVVDDSKFNRNRVVAALQSEGYTITEMENGRQAIDYLAVNPVDAIVSDLLMPEVDGFGLLRSVRQHQPDIPVIVLSADIQASSRQLCTELGAAEFVNKPFKPDELRSAVQRALALTVQEF